MAAADGIPPTPPEDVLHDTQAESSDNESISSGDSTTITTKTTTTTTVAGPKLAKGLQSPKALAAHHQTVHETTTALDDLPGSSPTLPSGSPTSTTSSASSVQRVIEPPGNRSNEHGLLPNSLDSDNASGETSIATSRSSTSPGTPSSADGYHAISTTTSVTTTKKRKVRRPTFEPRGSRLDPETMSKNQDPFRGFHTLFWIVMGAYGLITFEEEWTRVGKLFGGALFSSFSQDAIILTISDAALVLTTGVAFLLIKLVAKGWIRYPTFGVAIQHSFQVFYLLVAIVWTIWRDWPWVQSGFFTLHAITMLMKIHSYISYNGELSEKLRLLKTKEAEYAQMKKNDDETMDDDLHDSNDIDKNDDAQHRHQRRASEAAAALLQGSALTPKNLAGEIEELRSDLKTKNGELWPANVTVANFVDYLIVPSLIYELQYPRTNKIRPLYVFEKAVATLGTFTLLYLTTEHYIYPVVFDPSISPLRALVLLLIPFMMNYLMIFYIIFECICNAFAELSCFADRNFYEDWWNCISFDEWARKWNKPVHHFLLRHVYDQSIETLHLSKKDAAFATFFLSSCVHELVMMVVTRKVRLYLFALQMFQLPLIWMGNNKAIRERPRLANAVFWLGMFCGPPLLGVAYCYA